jgi:FHS family glucose/mannose:H+ symporter-like MFS transporter
METPLLFKKSRYLFWIIYNLTLAFALGQNIPGPLIPVFVKEFGIGYDRVGVIFFIGLFWGMASVISFGILSDRFRKKTIIMTGASILAAGSLGVFFSTNEAVFTVAFSLLWIGFGSLEAGLTTGIVELAGDKRSRALTIFSRFTGIGAFAGPILLFAILYFALWWRLIFLVIFIYLAVLLILITRAKYPLRRRASEGYVFRFREMANPVIIFGAIALLFHNGVLINVGSWLTTYLSFFDLDLSYGSVTVAFYWLAVILGRMLATRMIQVMDEKHYLILLGTLSIFFLIITTFVNIVIIKIIAIVLLGLSIGGMFPLLLSIVFSANPRIVGRIFSILGLVGYGSTMIFQLVTGIIAENFREGSVIYVPLANSVVCIIFVILMVRSHNIINTGSISKQNMIVRE